MTAIQRPLLRVAQAIHAELTDRRRPERLLDLPTSAWQDCERTVRQIRRVQLRGWHLAADQLRADFQSELRTLQSELATIADSLQSQCSAQFVATCGDIYQDLVALGQEFQALQYDVPGRQLSVTTDPITLEGQYLGPFEIRLDWRRLARIDLPPYRVVALDPHPAESREAVTHPHVLDEVLCEGDGRLAIRGALTQGRLLDFFTIVSALLHNYNPDSPFVELALWHGQSCSDCGAAVDAEECFSCHACQDSVCDGCEVLCGGCEYSYCAGCVAPCHGCHESYCSGCLQRCSGCRAAVCPSCLDDNERCANCHEEPEDDEPEAIYGAAAASAHIAIQPHGVGPAAVPA